MNLENIILPGGTTGVIQTADVCWNSPVKSTLKDLWAVWMREGEKSYTKAGKLRSPTKTQLVDMIVQAWNQVTEEQIKHSFVVCGQGDNLDPDKVLCMREGKSCREGLDKLKLLLSLPPKERRMSIFGEHEDNYESFVELEDDRNIDPLE